MAAKADTPEGERVDVLVTLIEAIKFRMKQSGLTSKDLEPMISPASDDADILGHKRPLTLKMISKLHRGLGIPAESLIEQPDEFPAA